jgi:pyruvate/2-oxoglutarate dehydrogenase complex dihydrolipoamide acyltransferase (E2) component
MPVSYELPIPNLDTDEVHQGLQLRVIECLVPEGSWVEIDAPVATVECGGSLYQVLMNGPGVLRQFVHKEGALVRSGSILAIIEADGESVPYGKPYSKSRMVAE